LNTIEKKNFDALRERDANLAEYVKRYKRVKFEIKESKRLANEGVKWLNLGSQGVVLLLGFGNGAFVKEIVRKFTKAHKLIVYEPDVGKFKYALSQQDFSDVLRSPYVTIMLGEVKEYNFVYMFHESMVNGHLWVVKNKYAIEDCTKGEMVDRFFAKFIEEKKFWDTNTGTQLNIGKHFANSILHNLPNILKGKSLSSLTDCCKGMPALVVSTGPSLENCIESVQKAKGKMVIIAIDTSAQFLLDHGITPDFVCGIDPLNDNSALFQTEEVRKIPLITMAQYTPKVLEEHLGDRYISGQMGNPVYTWLHWFWEEKGNPDTFGGSVSHYGCTIAQLMGCNVIGLIGQDLSFKSKVHAGDVTKKLHDWNNIEVPDETTTSIPTKNNLGEDCFTKGNFLSFKTAFETKIRHTPEIIWYNFTKGGLDIEGATNADLDIYLESLEPINVKIGYDYEPEYKIEGLIQRMEEGIKILKKVRKVALVILKKVHKMKALRNEFSPKTKEHYTNCRKIPEIARMIETKYRPKTQHPFLQILASYHYQLELYLRRYDITSIDEIKHKWKRFDLRLDRALNYYGELAEGCQLLYENIEIGLKKVKEMEDATGNQLDVDGRLEDAAIEA
jgi:hypothetical protein